VKLTFHPAVQDDFNSAVAYYEQAAGGYVADRFEAEIRQTLAAIAANPRRFAFYGATRIWRRARPRFFPYVIVYREWVDSVRVLVIKHEKRHPGFGMRRKG
jgi:plasmid stabilization system protein ParE